MAGEFSHKTVGSQLTQTEWEATTAHEADGETANDMLYFNGTYWIRAPKATILALLNVADGATVYPDTGEQAFLDADHTKLDAIEASADVTDATNVNTAGAVMEADFAAKGDILTATADDTPSILSVGTNTHVLTADSGEAKGIKWAAAAGAAHAILDGSTHNDSVADAVTRGSLIYGNSTPKWDELGVGAAGTTLVSDGTDASWSAARPDVTTAAVNLYVDVGSGSDSNAGTSGSPKATILGALDALPAVIAHTCTIKVRGQQNYPENNTALEFGRFNTSEKIIIKVINSSDEDMYDNGTADAGGGNDELVDAAKAWTDDQFNGAFVWIYKGTGKGQVRTISDTVDASDKVVVSVNWTTNPDATSKYVIGGGATMTGTDTYHTLNIGKKLDILGFKHTGATTADIYYSKFTSGIINYNWCDNVRGIYLLTASNGLQAYYNYIDVTTTGVLLQEMVNAYVRNNVIINAATGVFVQRASLAQMHATSTNYIASCTTGIKMTYGSGCMAASTQDFGAGGDANTTDIDPAVSTTIPQWHS